MILIKAIFLIILAFLAVIGLSVMVFLFTATSYDEDDIDNNSK